MSIYSTEGDAEIASITTGGTRPTEDDFILLMPMPTIQSDESWEDDRRSTCGVLCKAYGKDAPHCSRRSRRLMRWRVLDSCTRSCGFCCATLAFGVLVFLVAIMVKLTLKAWCGVKPYCFLVKRREVVFDFMIQKSMEHQACWLQLNLYWRGFVGRTEGIVTKESADKKFFSNEGHLLWYNIFVLDYSIERLE